MKEKRKENDDDRPFSLERSRKEKNMREEKNRVSPINITQHNITSLSSIFPSASHIVFLLPFFPFSHTTFLSLSLAVLFSVFLLFSCSINYLIDPKEKESRKKDGEREESTSQKFRHYRLGRRRMTRLHDIQW